MKHFPCSLLGLVLVIVGACASAKLDRAPSLVTRGASDETIALYRNLAKLSGLFVLFGHQNTTAYGVNWQNDNDRSDIKDVTGSYPAIFGWDIGHIEIGSETNLDGIEFSFIREQIQASYQRGAITTLSWHMRDLITAGSAWDKSASVAKLVPGGVAHHKLKEALDRFVEFNRSLKVETSEGRTVAVPILFRPWHEHNGDWFWWGKGPGRTSEHDFINLWRFTVDYLRHHKHQNNLIFVFSPDRSRMELEQLPQSYFYGYPGDDYVDVIGLDNYWDLGHKDNPASVAQKQSNFITGLSAIGRIAKAKNKVAALTEGGQETVSQPHFWTEVVLNGLRANNDSRGVAYLMVWRNANREREQRDHYFAPYKGHSSEKDFLEFYHHPATLFEQQLPEVYR